MKPILPLLVLADDLTGALDTGIKFSKKNLPTLVMTRKNFDQENNADYCLSVLVIDTETRHLVKEEASRIIQKIIRRAQSRYDIQNYYKKTDSTLRGNIGAELEAVMRATGRKKILFVPSYPSINRITYMGNQLMDGKLISVTEYAQDLLEPVSVSYIPDIIHQQSHLQVELVSHEDLNYYQQRQAPWQKNIADPTIYVFDAENNKHLADISQSFKKNKTPSIIAGCGGFAEFLPNLIYMVEQEPEKLECPLEILIINGSVNQLSIDQINYASQKGIPRTQVPIIGLLQRDFLVSNQYQKLINMLFKTINTSQELILTTAQSKREVLCLNKDSKNRERCLTINNNLGNLVRIIMEHCQWRKTLVVFGGDTAIGILNHLNAVGIIPQREIVPGVVLSEVLREEGKVCLITKAGGFGNINIISIIQQFLREVHQL